MGIFDRISKSILNHELPAFDINNPTSFRNDGSIPEEVGEQSIPVSSTAIASARYEPEDDSLNIAYTSNPSKEYAYKAGGQKGLSEWVNAPSKGRITNEWKTTHRMPGY